MHIKIYGLNSHLRNSKTVMDVWLACRVQQKKRGDINRCKTLALMSLPGDGPCFVKV